MTSTFREDLETGLQVEQKILNILRVKYPSASLINAFKGYDIWVPEKNIGVEVKSDKKSHETGNYLIEYEMSGKPSALMTTTAKYWVIDDGVYTMFIKPMDIIRCIFDNQLTHKVVTGAGDVNSKKCFLIPKQLLQQYEYKLK